MKTNPYTEKDFLRLAEAVATRFYKTYTNIFKDMSMEIEDAKQESALCVVELMQNKKFSGITLPLVKQAVIWHFQHMLQNQSTAMTGIKLLSIEDFTNNEQEGSTPDELTTDVPEKNSYLTDARLFFSKSFPEEQIKKLITQRQYEVLKYKIQDNLTFKEIGDKLGKTRQNAEWLYRNALKRLRLHFK